MINVLPVETKRQLRAARSNVVLLRYTILLAMVVGFLAIGTIAVYFVMNNVKANAENTTLENQSQISNFTNVQAEASEFRANLATAKTILDNEVIYSDTVLAIAQVIPSGVVIESLSLDANSFGSPMSISARAVSYDRAITLKDTLENSSVFSNVHFITVSGGSDESDGDEDSSGRYPYTVALSATLNSREEIHR